MAFGNLKYKTQLPSFERFVAGLAEPEVYARGGSEEPAWMTATRESHADPLGAAKKPLKGEYKKKPRFSQERRLGAANLNNPYEALVLAELGEL